MMGNAVPLTLSAQHVSREYGRHVAVCDISLQLKPGEILGLLGPNGAGKSTTMRMLTGNLAPSAGSIKICGIDLLDDPRSAKVHLGYLPEIPPLYADMRVNEYLVYVAKLHRIEKKQIPHAVENCKRQCALTDHGKQLIGTLSKGMQQRVGIAQAIIHQPDVIILDEPTVGLDPNQIKDIRELILSLKQSSSIVLSTHILPEVESVCDRVMIMHQGRIVLDELLTELKNQSADLETVFTQLTLETQRSPQEHSQSQAH